MPSAPSQKGSCAIRNPYINIVIMKLFISYNHADKDYIEKFIKQMTVITGEDKLIKDIWYDRVLAGGDDF